MNNEAGNNTYLLENERSSFFYVPCTSRQSRDETKRFLLIIPILGRGGWYDPQNRQISLLNLSNDR